jgi:hypothetical protein
MGAAFLVQQTRSNILAQPKNCRAVKFTITQYPPKSRYGQNRIDESEKSL